MRFVKPVCVLAMLALIAGAALADKYEPNEKDWHYGPTQPRADYPEEGTNDTCPGPQQLQCGDRIVCGSYSVTTDDDWYQVYLTAGSIVDIATDACQGSSVDTYLQLYSPDCSTLLVQDDDGGPGLFSLINDYLVPADGWYNIKTYSYSHLYTGNYILFITCTVPTPPDPNDTCNPDIGIARCTEGVLNGDVFYDNNNYDPLSGGCASGYAEAGKDVAYRLDLVAGDIVDLTYLQYDYDTAFYIVTDCANVPGTCVIGADDTFSGEPEVINYVVPATGTYWLILDAYGTGAGGAWTLNYRITCPGATGACCVDGRCTITTQADCGGQYMGDGTDCDPNPCPTPTKESSWGQIKASYR